VSPRTKLDRSGCYHKTVDNNHYREESPVRVGSMKPGGRIDVLLREIRNGKSGEQWDGDERRTCLMDGARLCGGKE